MTGRARWIAIAIALAACGGGGGDSAGLTAVEETFGVVTLRWSSPLQVTGRRIEVRVAEGAWTAISDPIPANTGGAQITIDEAVPELTSLAFRICGVACIEAGVMHGIHPPGALAASTGVDGSPGALPLAIGPITLSWANLSLVATELLVERQVNDGTSGPWVPLPVPFGQVSYADGTALEGVAYLYRVSYGANGVWSLPQMVNGGPLDLWEPSDVAVQPIPGGYRISWDNRSTTAQNLTLYRWAAAPGDSNPYLDPDRITLAADADHYDDLAAAFFPTTRYALRITSRDGFELPTSAPLVGLPSVPVPGALPLTGRSQTLPAGPWAARDAASQFHVLGRVDYGLRLSRATASGWDSRVMPNAAVLGPGLALDGQGRPHVLYRGLAGTQIGHLWHDGMDWQEEALAPEACRWGGDASQFGVAADGQVHLVCNDDAGTTDGATAVLVHRVRTAAGWSAPYPVPVTAVLSVTGMRLNVARDGTAYVLVTGFAPAGAPSPYAIALLTRDVTGSWTEQVLPLAQLPGTTWLVGGDAGLAGFFYVGLDADGVSKDVHYVPRSNAGLGAPELVQGPRIMDYGVVLAGAMSDDGSRVHGLAVEPPGLAHLLVRTADGWQDQGLCPEIAALSTGYGSDGKAWIVGDVDARNTEPLHDDAVWLE